MTITLDARRLSRRSFLVTVGGGSVAVVFGSGATGLIDGALAQSGDTAMRPNAWVAIAADGMVTIVSPGAEMGQGTMTAIPLLVAEEMDADWDKVRVIQAPADRKAYGNPGFGGRQHTGASRTTPGYFEPLRLVGAQTRLILLASGAELLGVPVGECVTEPGRVVHRGSGRSIGYGEIAARGKLPDALPQATVANLKRASEWRLIGHKAMPRIDVPSKTDGTAKFGIDVQLPGMLHGAVLRAPVQGEAPVAIDDQAARAVPGVLQIVPLPYGVGIVAETVEATRKAKDLLKVTWSEKSGLRTFNCGEALERYRSIGRDLSVVGTAIHEEGDAATAIAGAARVVAADYLSDHVYHAPMEPMTATALVSEGGVEIWAPTQSPMNTQDRMAPLLGIPVERVKVNTTLIGGGFGRKGETDFVMDAVLLGKAVPGRPVKVIWSREDDVQHDKYRPLAAQHVQIGLDDQGAIVGWRHRIVAPSVIARAYPPLFERTGGRDGVVTEGAEIKYHVPAHHIEYLRQGEARDVGFWRGVGSGYTKFAVECMLDEVAAAAGTDPIELRRGLLMDEPRALAVLNRVVEMADWSRPREGRALGFAYSDAFGAHCAQIAEISLNAESGEIRVHDVWCAIDPGIAVQPLNVEAQVSGAIIHGASQALYEQIKVVNGETQETNFDTYRVMRMSEVPEIHIALMPTDNPPTGVGEVGLPPVGAAIANAFARLTGGVRLRHYPLLPDRVKAALAAGKPQATSA